MNTELISKEELIKNYTEAIEVIKSMRKVTKVLGSGVGEIVVPEGFFSLWNDTEVKAKKSIYTHSEIMGLLK